MHRDNLFIVSDKKSANSLIMDLCQEYKMLLPIKFIAANIFVSGMIAGAVCGAVAVSTLSNPGRLNRLKDYLEESCEGRKK